jgi:hypothetical protein
VFVDDKHPFVVVDGHRPEGVYRHILDGQGVGGSVLPSFFSGTPLE